MLAFVQNWLAPPPHPIGISIGQRWIRMAQVECVEGEFRLVAASGIEISPEARCDPAQRAAFCGKFLRYSLSQRDFRGCRAVLAAPWSDLSAHHLLLPAMDESLVEKAVRWEARGKLPTDPANAIVRHFIAGEVLHENRPCLDVTALSMTRPAMNSLLAIAAEAKLDVLAIHAEPSALVDCFANIYRRKKDAAVVNAFIDIGCATTRIAIAQGRKILGVRTIALAADDFNAAAAEALHISVEEAAQLRANLALGELRDDDTTDAINSAIDSSKSSCAVSVGSVPRTVSRRAEIMGRGADPAKCDAPNRARSFSASPRDDAAKRSAVAQAIVPSVSRLAQELSHCCRQHASAFAELPVQRLIFVGGQAHHRGLCQSLAREIGIAAQVGDPLVRMGRTAPIGVESAIDPLVPQPSWAVAIGLSMGGSIYSRDAESRLAASLARRFHRSRRSDDARGFRAPQAGPLNEVEANTARQKAQSETEGAST